MSSFSKAFSTKYYIQITGIVFVLLTISHVARVLIEGMHVITEPIFAFTTVASICLVLWAWRLLKDVHR